MFLRLLAAVGLSSNDTLAVSSAAVNGDLTASAIAIKSAAGTHELTIEGYSRVKVLAGTGECVKSGTFAVGGHRWHIKCYPNGEIPDTSDSVSVYLTLEQPAAGVDVTARVNFSLLDHAGEPVPAYCMNPEGMVVAFNTEKTSKGHCRFIRKEELECSPYVRDDCLRIRCVVVVFSNEISTEDRDPAVELNVVPPPDIGRHLGGLLLGGEGADVTFDVDGEMFDAHKCVLAARSPVFKAKLFGPMKERNADRVPVEDMEARVFKTLLHFIYTDSLPDVDESDMMAMSQHLLVAADRYILERLKLICEDKLRGYVDAFTVPTLLALADRHRCHGLKKACFQFLMSPSNMKAAMATVG
ncbi:unnamed protein product [Urochloa decumbens]|uniref:BTB domain-containing protein n=1 Tax=Urochloa decumbens TaxID=240449 RepID=A0ABC9B1V9_9POAL